MRLKDILSELRAQISDAKFLSKKLRLGLEDKVRVVLPLDTTGEKELEVFVKSYAAGGGLPFEILTAKECDYMLCCVYAYRSLPSSNAAFNFFIKGYGIGFLAGEYLGLASAPFFFTGAATHYQPYLKLENFLLEKGKTLCVTQGGASAIDIYILYYRVGAPRTRVK